MQKGHVAVKGHYTKGGHEEDIESNLLNVQVDSVLPCGNEEVRWWRKDRAKEEAEYALLCRVPSIKVALFPFLEKENER